ncbi:Gp37-like protein [Amycolatopsis kentuckyensis]|uniref:Gp37-like protein n=1 Tax=Amycolatopsis kentuckyensis TaxID=218823 RepID=UPI0013028C51|nr:siphovirus ReqiPepy6 Gp37-like family protein [Amycolatopsis kentuckyensis]
MSFEWQLYIRDSNFQRQARIDDYESLDFTKSYNDVGSWTLKIDRRSPAAVLLSNPDWGIEVYRRGQRVFSGIWTEVRHTRDMAANDLQIQGASDEIWLLDRLVHPSPAEAAPPYTLQASSVLSGTASTVLMSYVGVNLGPSAIAPRRKVGLALGTDPIVGATVRGEGRWDSNLLTFLQPLATAGGVGFRVAQVSAGLEFQVYQGVDRSATVKMSVPLKNLESFEFTRSRPKANYVFVGASGTGTSRIIKEFSDAEAIATWERIEGPLVNADSTSTDTVINQEGADALAQNSEQVSLTVTPIESDDMRWPDHYDVGDTVAVQLDNPVFTPYSESTQVVDVVREIRVSLTPGGPQKVTPTLGTPSRGNISRLVRAYKQAASRINNLERS